jgi:hypothetical protein
MNMSENFLPVQVEPVRREVRVVESRTNVFDTAKFEHMLRIAKVMAQGSLVPETLRTNKQGLLPLEEVVANCFLVVNAASNWDMDPFMVAQACSVVHGRLMFEGKLVAAVLQQVAGIRLRYEYFGNEFTEDRGVRAIGRFPNESEDRMVSGTVKGWRTNGTNNPWSKPSDFDRQLAYRSAREWARIHEPGAILGVYGDDEFDDVPSSSPSRTIDAKPKPLLLDASFPEKEKAAFKKAVVTEAKPQKATAKPVDVAKVETKAQPPAEAKQELSPSLSFADYQALMVEGVANPLDLINQVTFADGKIAIDQATLASVWVLASPFLDANIEGSVPQAIAAVAGAGDLDTMDDLISHVENANHFKSMELGARNSIKTTFAALRARLVGLEAQSTHEEQVDA